MRVTVRAGTFLDAAVEPKREVLPRQDHPAVVGSGAIQARVQTRGKQVSAIAAPQVGAGDLGHALFEAVARLGVAEVGLLPATGLSRDPRGVRLARAPVGGGQSQDAHAKRR